MSAVGSQLLEVVRADPSDAPRLVYADWLEDQGDLPRAAFVRAQIARAQLPWWDRRAVALELEERALLAQHEAAWRAGLPELEGVTWGSFRRGFVDRVAFEDTTFLDKHLPAVLAAAPLAGLVFPWPRLGRPAPFAPMPGLKALTVHGALVSDADLEWLAGSPILAGLEELNLVGSGLGDDGLGRLLGSGALGSLRALRLPHHRIGNGGISALSEAELPALTELDLSGPTDEELGSGGRDDETIDADGMTELVAWPGFARLRSLDLTGQQIQAVGLTSLVSVPSSLKVLHVRNVSDIYDEETLPMAALRRAHPSLRLEELSIGESGLDGVQAVHLTDAACLSELRALRVNRVFDAEVGALQRLGEAPWLDGIGVLEFNYSDGGSFLPAVLGRSPGALHTLVLRGGLRRVKDAVIAALASSPVLNGLLSLDLSGNQLRDGAAAALAGAAGLRALSWLNVDGNRIDEEAADALAASPLGQRLTGLDARGQRRLPSLGVSGPTPEPIRVIHGTYSGPLGSL